MSAVRKMLREQARRRHASATNANKAIARGNAAIQREHLAELATLPEGWTSVTLDGEMRAFRHVPEKPRSRAKAKGA